MCGIVAILSSRPDDLVERIGAMNATLVHRGPDDEGLLTLPDEGVALGMRRLSILDLEGGHQPMWDENCDHAVVFNGEIYNFAELRQCLKASGHRFRTDHSDTEVLVHGFEEWGVGLLPRLNGMFAFALWDRRRRRLVVARDRLGEKPLFIARTADGFAIASELKALFADPQVERTLDPVALEQYLCFGFTVSPRSILANTTKLPAGHYAEFDDSGCKTVRYWSLPAYEMDIAEAEALERLETLLDASVRARMVADVPVGLFLSGGLDSTSVGYFMTRHSAAVHSFSIGFEDARFDETRYARLAARSLGTTHHVEVFPERRVADMALRVPEILDEPMADSSILPTFLVSELARKRVKVALGGDGSDELLMGYRTYQALKIAWQFDILPSPVLRLGAGLATYLPESFRGHPLRGKIFAEQLSRSPAERLLARFDVFRGGARDLLSLELCEQAPPGVMSDAVSAVREGLGRLARGAANETIAAYAQTYLQEDILVKVDRASMAASLEVRSPFLDRDLVDFVARLPPALKLRHMTRKHLLRRLMRGRIPDAIIDRRKQGFGAPLASWLRGPLAPLVREYLSERRLQEGGVFNAPVAAALAAGHLDGIKDNANQLWWLLLFELWRERWHVGAVDNHPVAGGAAVASLSVAPERGATE